MIPMFCLYDNGCFVKDWHENFSYFTIDIVFLNHRKIIMWFKGGPTTVSENDSKPVSEIYFELNEILTKKLLETL